MNNLEDFLNQINELDISEVFKSDIRYFVHFLKPLPEYIEKNNDSVYLTWSSEKGCVRYKISEQKCDKDLIYWMDIVNREDYLLYDPAIAKIDDVLEWLYGE